MTSKRLTAPLFAGLVLGCVTGWLATPAEAGQHRIGLGVNYWKTIDDLEEQGIDNVDEIDDSGLSQVASYQYWPKGVIGFQIDVERFPDGFGGSTESSWSPQVYLTVGHGFYGGIGIGITNSSDFEDDWSDPFYAAKAGFNLGLLPRVSLDIYGNYRFDAWSELEDADTDTVFLGALLRIEL